VPGDWYCVLLQEWLLAQFFSGGLLTSVNILFAGVGYFPYVIAGEKNYFFRLVPLLKQHANVVIFSLNDYAGSILWQDTVSGPIPVYCARRPFHRDYERFHFRGDHYTTYHHRHKPPQEIIEKFISVVAHLPHLYRIIHRHSIKVIHFMDNFGLAMPFLGKIFPRVKVTYSAANYDPRGSQSLYDVYLKLSIGFLDGAGVYTQAYLTKLRAMGIKIPLKITRWGVPVGDQGLEVEQKRAIRRRLGIGDEQRFLLWSGYLQQIQERDFYRTVQIAHMVAQKEHNVTFVFAFKPETFRSEYLQQGGDRIRIVTGLKNFGAVLEAADLFLSPIGNSRSTVSPPLTWLEAMSKGSPVITTAVGGVDELIIPRETGYVASSYDSLVRVTIEALHDDSLDAVSRRAKDFVRKKFSIERSAEALLRFWREVVMV
jgi:glycosyltransferase involved in cell wall biosynthesis